MSCWQVYVSKYLSIEQERNQIVIHDIDTAITSGGIACNTPPLKEG
jgi:hypothetical protein